MPTESAFPRAGQMAIFTACLALLAACGRPDRPVSGWDVNDPKLSQQNTSGSILGDALTFGGRKKASTDDSGTGIGVNAFLWRSSLETLSFMPLASADPFGGVIITDWYQPAASSGERFKATAYILGRELRADGLRVSIFRQVAQGNQWVDAPVAPSTVTEIENKILAKAREMRAQLAGS